MFDLGQLSQTEMEEMAEAAEKAIEGSKPIRGDLADFVRMTRSREPWERYDSVVVARGASQLSRGWFDTFADFGNASTLEWFAGRSSNIGPSYTNQNRERTDFAQDFYQLSIEFIAPVGMGDLEEQANDAQWWPLFWTTILPSRMAFTMKLAQSDTILQIPGNHAPGGTGVAGLVLDQSAAPTVYAGNNGQAWMGNTWKWPEPVMVPAKASISVKATIDDPARQLLTQYATSPGVKNVPMEPPDPQGATNPFPNEFIIKVTNRGPRYLQLRGARSA